MRRDRVPAGPVIHDKEIEINGDKYTGQKWKDGPGFWSPEKEDAPIICECGNDKFRNFYGVYVLYAICPNCGAKHEIYSG